VSPIRIITGATIIIQIPKNQINIINQLSTCTPISPLGFNCVYTLDLVSDPNYYILTLT